MVFLGDFDSSSQIIGGEVWAGLQTSEGLNGTQGSVSGVLNQLTGTHGTLKSSSNTGANFPQ